jgi:hypothetical protein
LFHVSVLFVLFVLVLCYDNKQNKQQNKNKFF